MTEEELENLTVYYNDKVFITLSPKFLDNQKAWDNLDGIKKAFANKAKLFDLMRNTKEKSIVQEYARQVTENEFEIQKLFNFEPDAKFHIFWRMPQCSCPSMDNEERWGTGYNIHNGNCVIHGFEEETKCTF